MRNLHVPAIRYLQNALHPLYVCVIDGKQLHEVATVSRIRRDDGALAGYQRPEVSRHVAQIREYVQTSDALLPTALVVAFDSRVTFTPACPDGPMQAPTPGTLTIPLDDPDGCGPPGLVVDGQQRAAALRDATLERFPVAVSAFVTDDPELSRTQFLLVNSAKPLPRNLIHELLPETTGVLPRRLTRRRLPATLLAALNHDDDSVLRGRIRTATCPEGEISDTAVLSALEHSLSDGVLWRYRSPDGDADLEAMLRIVKGFFAAVSLVWPAAFTGTARTSRLVHGAGITSLGFVMDAIAEQVDTPQDLEVADWRAALAPLTSACAWTSGTWRFGPDQRRRWDELQNTGSDIRLLSDHLLYLLDRGRPAGRVPA